LNPLHCKSYRPVVLPCIYSKLCLHECYFWNDNATS
jgi:hypothetical protein